MHPGGETREPHFVEHCFCDGKPDLADCYTDNERQVARETGHLPMCFSLVPHYSTTWEGLGLVVEAMRKRGWVLELWVGDEHCTASWLKCVDKMQIHSKDFQHAPGAVAIAAARELERKREGTS